MKLLLTSFLICLSTGIFSQSGTDIDIKTLQEMAVKLQRRVENLENQLEKANLKVKNSVENVMLLSDRYEIQKIKISTIRKSESKLRAETKILLETNRELTDANKTLVANLENSIITRDSLKQEWANLEGISDKLRMKLSAAENLTKEQIDTIQNLRNKISSLQEIYKKQLGIDSAIREQSQNIRITQMPNTVSKTESPAESNFLIFADGGALIGEKGTPTGNISIGFSPGNLFVGFIGGVHSYYKYGFTAYPIGLSVKYSALKAYTRKPAFHPIIFADAGYSYINEKYEVIDNFKQFGFFANIGMLSLFSVSQHFGLTIGVYYKNQEVREFSEILKTYITNTISNINVNAGILIKL